ncbi:MAG: sigma-54-dependent Fis family transcriptional regulator [Rhodocyclaceae bacterium]
MQPETPSVPPLNSLDALERSWERSAGHGLAPTLPQAGAIAPRNALAERLECNARLITYAQPVIEHLHQQISRSSSMVLLADSGGMILRAVGDSDFVGRAARISLAPGAIWSESCVGTNAIGTALHEQKAVAVFGEQHFLECNRFLNCLATPILAPGGGLLGILDISSDARVTQSHAQALLQTTVEMIENRLIEAHGDGALVLHLHPAAEMLGTPLEGLAVFDEDGTLLACNRRASALLGLDGGPLSGQNYRFRRLFAIPWASLRDHALRYGTQPIDLRTTSGRLLATVVKLRNPARPRSAAPAKPALAKPRTGEPADAVRTLAALDAGDERMAEAVRRAQRIAEHDIPLLIQGETGTGKEIFAKAFHRSGRRRAGPFVAINCAAIPASLIEAELFGHVAGAYTGALAQGARGKLREAHGGTFFLDEIGDMPLNLQAVLLRVLETRRVAPLGGGPEEAVDIGLVCASHRPLRELTALGTFRADLFFRLSGMTVSLPALRERSDFAALVRQILDEEGRGRSVRLSPEVLSLLQRHPWPGNLRQLRNVLRLATALMGDDAHCLTQAHLPQDVLDEVCGAPSRGGGNLGLRAGEQRMVQEAVTRNGGNISAAARDLGITRTTLYRKLRQG